MNSPYDLIIIGAGPGGYEAAFEAARLGLHTALIEKDSLGGTCLNRGCIPTKTLIHTAGLYDEIRQASRFGISSGSPVLDMQAVQRHKADTIVSLQKGIAARLKAAKIDVFYGAGTLTGIETLPGPGDKADLEQLPLHRVRISADDNSVTMLKARHILLATGSMPSVPPIPGHDLPGVMTSNELLSYEGEPFESLLIIGGGVIGVEFAGIWQSFGTKVTILEALPSLLANLDRELGQSLKLSMKKKGTDIHTGAAVQSLTRTEDGICCAYLEKEKTQTVTAQAVLIATGRRPYTQGLFAEGCAPATERGRILTNEYYETTIPGIYAIGDVIGQVQLAHAAAAQGLRAVRHIAGMPDSTAPLLIPSCVYTTPEISSVGLTLDEAKAKGIPAASHKVLSSANGKSVLTLQERGFVKVIYEEDTHTILGAQLLCARATDMISEFTEAIQHYLTLEDLAEVIHPHPSFSEMIAEAVRI
ncbi:MAG: dihydrolipoyl dehydrogenase [Lachnospiraceae bacterium]|nr:dihydrolipoyl dehydrogenase [Lachnospiraceae bacterium]